MFSSRKVLLLILVLLSLGLCFQVSSYSYAHIKSPVNLTISSSEQALIAVPEEDIQVKLYSITKENTSLKEDTSQADHNLLITNNMNVTIFVSAKLENYSKLIKFDSTAVLPGQNAVLTVSAGQNVEGKLSSPLDDTIIISAEWKSGYAEIQKKVYITPVTDEKEAENDLHIQQDSSPAATEKPTPKAAPRSTPKPTEQVPVPEQTQTPVQETDAQDGEPDPAASAPVPTIEPDDSNNANDQTNDNTQEPADEQESDTSDTETSEEIDNENASENEEDTQTVDEQPGT
jgi:hypothetical protein